MSGMEDALARGAERRRIDDDARRETDWRRFGLYLAERQWATVREDYSADGRCWEYSPHDHARSRVYRWGEDGLLGCISHSWITTEVGDDNTVFYTVDDTIYRNVLPHSCRGLHARRLVRPRQVPEQQRGNREEINAAAD